MAFSERMDGYSVFGTLIIRGPLFASLSSFFLAEFEALPRIGDRTSSESAKSGPTLREKWRIRRQQHEKEDGLIWTVANVRGFVLVKFASREVEGSRNWLKDMLKEEGSLMKLFGERALLCLK
jgi:urease accessory protein